MLALILEGTFNSELRSRKIMRKIIRFILPFVCFFTSLTYAQSVNDSLVVDGKSYTLHKVAQGETLYSVCNRYKVDMTEVTVINKMGGNGYSLSTGEMLMIPLYAKKPTLVDTKSLKVSDDGYITHLVKQGETLYSICRSYNGVTVPMLREKNNLESDALKINQKLLIPQEINVKAAYKDVKKEGAVVKEISTADKEQVVAMEKQFTGTEKSSETLDITRGVATWISGNNDQNMKNYYALHKYAPIGTLIKVRNLMNNRTAFVKVIGKLPDTEEYKSIAIKVSGAAAYDLQVLDNKFLVEMTIPQGGKDESSLNK